jgi:hypothetical protein
LAQRQPQAVPPLAPFIRLFGGEERLEQPGEVFGGDPRAGVLHANLREFLPDIGSQSHRQHPPLRHRLPGVHHEVENNLLNLARIDRTAHGMGREAGFQPHPVVFQVFFDQQQYIADQDPQVGRLAAFGPPAGVGEQARGDAAGALPRRENLLERLGSRLGILVPQPQLGIVDDGRQHIVELVGDRRGQFAHRGQPLGPQQLLLQLLQLVLQTGDFRVGVHDGGCSERACAGWAGDRARVRKIGTAATRGRIPPTSPADLTWSTRPLYRITQR